MSRRRATALLGLAIAWGSGASLWAGDDPADNAIQATQQEFDSLKAAAKPEPAGTGRAGLPGLNVIAAPAPAAANPVPVRGQSADDLKKAKRAQNWLVDAMMKPQRDPGDRSKSFDDEDETADDEDLAPFEKLIAEQLRGKKDEAKATPQGGAMAEHDTARLENAFNPLDGFMSAWISPRDHDLLLTAKNGGTDPGPTALPGRDAPAMVPGGSLFGGTRDISVPDLLKPAGNPFLNPDAAMGPSPAVGKMPEPLFRPEAPVSAPSLTPPPAAPRQPTESKAPLPDNLKKAEEDARYFPQLKRF